MQVCSMSTSKEQRKSVEVVAGMALPGSAQFLPLSLRIGFMKSRLAPQSVLRLHQTS